MRPADSHLTPQEFELVLLSGAGPNLTTAERAQAQEAKQHLEGCEYCQSVAKQYAKVDSALGRLKARPNPVRKKDCPEESVWLEVAAGLADEGQSAKLLEHATQCDYCGKLLREAAEDAAAEPDKEIDTAVAALATAQPDRQRALAAMLAKTPAAEEQLPAQAAAEGKRVTARPRSVWWPKLVWTAGVAVILAAASLVWLRTREPDVNKLLAQAYTEQRTIELRMPGAQYGPMRVELGNEKKDFPPQFYTAESIIKSKLANDPENSVWLHEQARAHLLEWKYDQANHELDDALMLKPNDPGLLLDKAMALYEQGKQEQAKLGEAEGSKASLYFNEAVNDLGRVLEQDPGNSIALFNRAILYQELLWYEKAIEDFDQFRKVEPNGSWANEALKRSDELKKLVNRHGQALSQPLADPQLFASLTKIPARADELDQRIEDYQDIAIKDWLPRTFSPQASPEIRNSLDAVAQLLQTRHGDRWMKEFLAADPWSGPAALNALGNAIEEKVGHASRQYSEAKKAYAFFAAAGNNPGMMRAEAEEVHALRNQQMGQECLDKALPLAESLKHRNYVWMQARLDTDISSCYLMTGEFELGRTVVLRSLQEARKGRFSVAMLRSMGIEAAVDTDEGQIRAAWGKDQNGLAAYWQNNFAPPRRAQQFYDDLSYAAENTGSLETALILAQQSVEMSVRAEDRILEAMTRRHYAAIAAKMQKRLLAEKELEISGNLLSSALKKETSEEDKSDRQKMETYRVYAQTSLAEIEAEEGKLGQAESQLDSIRKEVANTQSFTVPRAFDTVYGDLLVKEGRINAAERVFQHAVADADERLTKLKSSAEHYSWMQENSGLYRSLIQLELTKGDVNKALAAWEWYRHASFGGNSMVADSLQSFSTAPDMKRRIADLTDRTVLSYALLPDGLEIWRFDNRGMDHALVKVDAATLSDMSAYFVEMCSNPESDLVRLRLRGRKLYELLLHPVVDHLDPSRTVVIEPDEVTGDLPFDALVAEDNRYFGEAYRVVLSPGLLYRQSSGATVSLSRSSRVLVVGSTAIFADSDATLLPAPDVIQQAEDVAAVFPKHNLLKGSQATVKAMEAALPQADALHYVGHALSTASKEGLLLFRSSVGNDVNTAIWNAERVNARPQLLAKAKLVVLAACSTGGSYRGRQEIHGELVRSLLQAGVPVVIGSRWNVNSTETGRFMKLFYANLVTQHPTSASIQVAESAMRMREETRHPYYWAAFGVFGGD